MLPSAKEIKKFKKVRHERITLQNIFFYREEKLRPYHTESWKPTDLNLKLTRYVKFRYTLDSTPCQVCNGNMECREVFFIATSNKSHKLLDRVSICNGQILEESV